MTASGYRVECPGAAAAARRASVPRAAGPARGIPTLGRW